jgi:Fe2+ or Zn2+ uptake regulation protein
MVATRETKYIKALKIYFNDFNHSTNQQALSYLRLFYPNLTSTTVHRITTRLLEQKFLKLAPMNKDGERRFDSNLVSHDHFHCQNCDSLRDIELPNDLKSQIENLLDDCKISGNLIISGLCRNCLKIIKE